MIYQCKILEIKIYIVSTLIFPSILDNTFYKTISILQLLILIYKI